MSSAGHHVVLVPVPALEPVVRGRWEHYDPAWVSTDPAFTHAHITVLSPFLVRPRRSDLQRIGQIATDTAPFDFTLAEVEAFPNGCLHLKPTPAERFARLTRLLCQAFPMCPPYAGEYDAVPHLTLDHLSEAVTLDSTRALLDGTVPVTCRADRLELHWYQQGRSEVRHVWELGKPLE